MKQPKRGTAHSRAFGSLRGQIKILGDIIAPIDVVWNATLTLEQMPKEQREREIWLLPPRKR